MNTMITALPEACAAREHKEWRYQKTGFSGLTGSACRFDGIAVAAATYGRAGNPKRYANAMKKVRFCGFGGKLENSL